MWELDCEGSWAPKNWCFWTVVLEKTLESPLDCMEIQPVHPKGNLSLAFIGRTDVKAETPVGHLMRRADSFEKTLMMERLKAGGEGDDRGWDGRIASPTQWTWVWVNSRNWWWTERPGVLQSMGSQRVRHSWSHLAGTYKLTSDFSDRGWDGWIASPTKRICIWANSWRWWRTRKPGMLQSMGSRRARHDWCLCLVTQCQGLSELLFQGVSVF